MIIIHCMLKKEYEKVKDKQYYGKNFVHKDGFLHFSTWNSFYDIADQFVSNKEEQVILCVDTEALEAEIRWEDMDGSKVYYPHLYGALNMNSVVNVVPFLCEDGKWKNNSCIHILMNVSTVNDTWCYPTISQYIHKQDNICVVAFSFWEDTSTLADWEYQYDKGKGMWYKANTDVWQRYGIKEKDVVWLNYFVDDKETAYNKIVNSSVLFFTGGAPDLMMKRIKEFELEEVMERFQGVSIGYSAGAMVQLKDYHITPDEDYSTFSYEKGLHFVSDFDIEVHYQESKVQMECIQKVIQEKKKDVYAIYEDGGLLVKGNTIQPFGRVKKFCK